MATNTTNYNLVKPAYADTADIADINGNMDIIDGQMKTNANNISSNGTAISNVQDGLAIVATGNTHAAIPAGRFVYIKNHGSLADGLYKNTSGSTIVQNATLSSSNVTADSTGGLNALASDIATLNGKMTLDVLYDANQTYTDSVGTNVSINGNYTYIYKQAGLIHFKGYITLSANVSAWGTLFTMKSNIRTNKNLYFNISSGSTTRIIYINSNGEVSVAGTAIEAGGYLIDVIYPA